MVSLSGIFVAPHFNCILEVLAIKSMHAYEVVRWLFMTACGWPGNVFVYMPAALI